MHVLVPGGRRARHHQRLHRRRLARLVRVRVEQLPPAAVGPPASLAVANCDAVSAALALTYAAPSGAPPPAILNFADAFRRGGGYLTGASAQEEDLCRVVPDLYPALCTLPYPLDPAVAPAVLAHIARDGGTLAITAPPVPVVVVTAAALDMRPPADGSPLPSPAAYDQDMRRRVRAVLFAALHMGCRDLVLGAWGCGVFANDARKVAAIFAAVLRSAEWRHRFGSVVFAIPRRGRGTIASIFSTALDRLTRP